MKALPNILSLGRILLTLAMFAALVAIGAGRDPGGSWRPSPFGPS